MDTIRILIVDDAVVVRRLLKRLLENDPQLQVVGAAINGRDALDKLGALKPDLLILDMEMPEMDGLETLKVLRREQPGLPVIMFSTLTTRGAMITLEALALGAQDYVAKPEGAGGLEAAGELIRASLVPKIKALFPRLRTTAALQPTLVVAPGAPGPAPAPTGSAPPAGYRLSGRPAQRVELLAIAASTGGPNALATVLENLPAGLPVPVAVVQHMPPIFTRMLAERLDSHAPLRVAEAYEGCLLTPGSVWIAPGDHHLVLRRHGQGLSLGINQNPPENSCRPAADVLFRSVVEVLGGRVLAVVLTGMGQDGLAGCSDIHRAGGQVIVQDQASSVVWGMPGHVAKAGLADQVLPLEQIAPAILARLHPGGSGRAGTASTIASRLPSGSLAREGD